MNDEGTTRGWRPSIARGALVGFGVALITYLVLVLPIYTLASFDPQGLDRPHFRTALVFFSLPVGTLVGVVAGILATRWFRHGHTWTAPPGGQGLGQRDDDPPVHDDWPI